MAASENISTGISTESITKLDAVSGTAMKAAARISDDADLVLPDREQRLIGVVARLVLAGFAVKHAALRSAR